MKKLIEKINNFEIKIRDEFGIPIYKGKGKPTNLIQELNYFMEDKGLLNGRTKNSRKK